MSNFDQRNQKVDTQFNALKQIFNIIFKGDDTPTLLIPLLLTFLVLQWCGIIHALCGQLSDYQDSAFLQSILCPMFCGIPALYGFILGISVKNKKLIIISLLSGLSSLAPLVICLFPGLIALFVYLIRQISLTPTK